MEAAKCSNIEGTSLEVPNVQELAKNNLSSVPSRYIRPHEHPLLPYNNNSSSKIPTIDFQNLLHGSQLHLFHNACQQWGFFQLVNHGVDSTIIEKMESEMREFFDLPIEVKNKYKQVPGDVQGYGQVFVKSEEQKLDWGDRFFLVTSPSYMRMPHFIPQLHPAFRDAIECYSSELKIIGMKIFSQMAKALDMKDEEMKILCEEGMQSMRMNYYPPCPQPDLVTGFRAHSDANALTILLQANEIEGLQIKKDGVWIPVTPLPNAFVVNIGDILEIVTNGSYKSIEHRVATNSKKERLSIATFFTPVPDSEFGPAPSLISSENPAKYRRSVAAEYYKGLYSRDFVGRTNLDAMKI